MILWTSDLPQPCACDNRRPVLSCATCRAQIEALTYAVAPWLLFALVVWLMVALGVRASDIEHAAAMRVAQPQIERVTSTLGRRASRREAVTPSGAVPGSIPGLGSTSKRVRAVGEGR